MARRGTGRWVERAAATGGGRTYRGQTPVRFYASIVIICVLGVGLVFFSRYERQHPVGAAQPAVGAHWYAALAFDVCGNLQPNLPANPPTRSQTGISTQGDGIIHVSPASKAESGSNATLGRFVQGYRGLQLTSDVLRLPGTGTYRTGGTCPAGTPDAGKHGSVQLQMWPSASGSGSQHPVQVGDPSGLKLTNGQMITAAFVPKGKSIPKPAGSTIVTLLGLVSGQSAPGQTPGAPTPGIPTPGTPTPVPGAPTTPVPATPSPVTPTPARP